MRNKTLVVAVAAALLGSGAAFAQVKGPGTGVVPEGPSNGGTEGFGGITCTGSTGFNCPALIADNPGPAVNSSFALTGCSGPITDLNVGVDITHSWVGDLRVSVTAPNLATVTIIDRPGVPASIFGCSGDNIFAVLDDEAGSPVETECAGAVPTINGSFTPNNALSALDGVDPNGTWTLSVQDFAGGDTGTLNDWGLEVLPEGCTGVPPGEESIARFAVNKNFDDDNPAEVEVTLSCNTGLPLEQTTSIAEGDGVVFVVTDFANGAMDCEVTEGGAAGYDTEYFFGVTSSPDGCAFEGVVFEGVYGCNIENSLLPVDVEVTKEWIDENPQFNPTNYAEATYSCVNEQFEDAFGQLEFLGNPGFDSFNVFPHWDGTTTCSVTESLVEGGVEADSSDCQGLSVVPGDGASCTIVNTRLFEGIPTLSQYGLTLLAMLMLGVGFVAFRRMS